MSAAENYDAYLSIRTSLYHFGCVPSELENENDSKKLEEEIHKQRLINDSVQRAPEYSSMIVPEKELDHAIEEIYKQIPEEFNIEDILEENGLNQISLRKAVELDLRVSAVLNYIAEQEPEVTDVDAEIFYEMHNDRFLIPEQRKTRHMLVTINDEFKENSREEAYSRIVKVQQELTKKPSKFAKLAKRISECPTAIEEGVLGVVSAGQLYPEIDEVLFSMKKGQISKVVESTLGYHVLACDDIIPARMTPFNDVKEKIKLALRKRNQRKAQRQWLQLTQST